MKNHSSKMTGWGGLATLSLLAVASCSKGTIGAPELSILPGGTGSLTVGGNGVGPGNNGGGASPGIGVQTLTCDPSVTTPGPSFVRRLNRFEYDNTVRDLLGDTTQPGNSFPSEEMRLGFDNNATALQVSPALVEQYMNAAESLATTAVSGTMSGIVSCDPVKVGSDACAQTFIQEFGQKAYRRPITADEATSLKSVFDIGAQTDFPSGVRLVIETVLQSAPFLYRVEFGQVPTSGQSIVKLTSWEMASRLSYMLWQSMPDDELYAAAKNDALVSPTDIATQVTRMMQDPKAHDVFAHFHEDWLLLDKLTGIEKDPVIFPTFTSDLVPLMAEESRRFLDWVVWDGPGTLDALLTSPTTFVNDKLAGYYGIPSPGANFTRVNVDPATHAGFLTLGGTMAMIGKPNDTAPVQRGKFVREQLLCHQLPPPPANIMIVPPELSPTLTTRERFAAHRTQPLCATCHTLMDPIGLGFENFDGAGHFRSTENGQTINVTGQVADSDIPNDGAFNGPVDLAQKLAASDQVKSCVTTSWFRYAYGRAETDDDACTLAAVNKKFADSKYNLKSLVVALTTTDAFLYRKVIPAGGDQ